MAIVHNGIMISNTIIFLKSKKKYNTEERQKILMLFWDILGADRINYLTGDREFLGQKWFDFIQNKIKPFRIIIRKTAIPYSPHDGYSAE